MKTRARAMLLRVTLLAVVWAVSLAGTALAADTLGARIFPRVMTWEQGQRTITVQSLATVPVDVSVLIEDGAGWDLGLSGPFRLEPNETREVPVTAAGTDNATYVVLMSAASLSGGQDSTNLRLTGTLRHTSPFDDLTPLRNIALIVGGVLLVLAFVFLTVRWGRRHVRIV